MPINHPNPSHCDILSHLLPYLPDTLLVLVTGAVHSTARILGNVTNVPACKLCNSANVINVWPQHRRAPGSPRGAVGKGGWFSFTPRKNSLGLDKPQQFQ